MTAWIPPARLLLYVTTADGQMLMFSFLSNNFTVPNRSIERVQDAVGVYLASMRLR